MTDATTHQLTWTIDQEATSPAAAAVEIWRSVFGRGAAQPTPDEACVFTVADARGHDVQIDLSDPQHAHLFAEQIN